MGRKRKEEAVETTFPEMPGSVSESASGASAASVSGAGEPADVQFESAPGISDLCRLALGTLGQDASISDVLGYAKERYGLDLEPKKNTLSATLSGIRKKLKEGNGSAIIKVRKTPSQASPIFASDPTGSELLAVKKLVDEEGGIEAIKEWVDKVEDLADKVGGLPKLRKCLELLEQLTA